MEGKEIIEKAELFNTSLNGSTLQAILPQRNRALEFLKQNGFPNRKSESYKYSNVSKTLKDVFEDAPVGTKSNVTEAEIHDLFVKQIKAHHLVFINGVYNDSISQIEANYTGLSIQSFKQLSEDDSELLKQCFGQYASDESDAFTALNTALANEGLFIDVSNNTKVELPIICYYITDTRDSVVHTVPRTLYRIGKSAEASFVHIYHTIGDNPSLTNEVNEIVLEENAICNFYKIQNDKANSYAVGETKVYQPNNCRFSGHTITLEGALIRNNLNIDIDGQSSEANMYGLYLTKGKTHVDNNTSVDHMQPNSQSNELYKGIIDEKSTGVFNGKIYVRQEAQKTNAFQSNNNILLSDSATINTKPQLEIWADDVKCSHGCTTGQLDEEGVFYLRSRGISEKNARAMILNAFAADVIEKIEFDWLREYLQVEISKRLNIELHD